MQYKLILFHYDGKPNVVEGNYEQLLNVLVGTIDDKMTQWFSHTAIIPMNQEIGTLNNVATELQLQAETFVQQNFNNA